MIKASEIIIHVTRGSLTESHHNGHIAVVNHSGETLYELGNPQHKTFIRSTAKPLQAISVIESGAADEYHISPQEIALLCASHNGEAEHVAAVESILTKLNLDPSYLLCGIHDPYHRETRINMLEHHQKSSSLHNNCSGKHAGMLTLAKHLHSLLSDYMSPSHPVQQLMLQTISEMAEIQSDQIDLGTDGCGVPVFALQMKHLALAYARLGHHHEFTPERAAACQRIIDAITQNPFYLAGSDRFDTRLLEVTNGRIIGKMGAEGVYAVTVPSSAIGIAVKVEDGAQRALYPTVVEILKQLDLLNDSELKALITYHIPAIKNRRGEEVGKLLPVFKLRKVN